MKRRLHYSCCKGPTTICSVAPTSTSVGPRHQCTAGRQPQQRVTTVTPHHPECRPQFIHPPPPDIQSRPVHASWQPVINTSILHPQSTPSPGTNLGEPGAPIWNFNSSNRGVTGTTLPRRSTVARLDRFRLIITSPDFAIFFLFFFSCMFILGHQ